jgi:hypothetical protein
VWFSWRFYITSFIIANGVTLANFLISHYLSNIKYFSPFLIFLDNKLKNLIRLVNQLFSLGYLLPFRMKLILESLAIVWLKVVKIALMVFMLTK